MTRLNAVKKSATIWLAPLVLLAAVALCAPIGWAFPASAKDQAPKAPDGTPAQVQFQIIHSFGGPGDGVGPGGVVTDGKGNLYGTTESGGAYGYGTVFELTLGANGQWTETILHSFQAQDPSDGWNPEGLVIDDAGNLYGTTEFGGDADYCDFLPYGCGVIFELSPGANGEWTESILYNFCSLPGCADGVFPSSPPTIGPGGILYGIATYAAYQLTPGSGGWTYDLVYTFCSQPGCNPTSGLTLDAKGNLYGEGGNGECCGLVFVLQLQPNGQWNQTVLYNFPANGENGGGPNGGLTFHDGGLYGVTLGGGDLCVPTGGCGTVFELTHGSGQMVNEQVIWNFGGEDGALGALPAGGVAFDKQGDLFGTTAGGNDGDGIVYGMKPQGNGKWAYHVLHTFTGSDGYLPDGSLTIDSKGDLFGTTGGGGQYGGGVAFELSPTTQAAK